MPKKLGLNKKNFILTGFLILLLCSLAQAEDNQMKLTSPDFSHNTNIPKRFTCVGDGINPALNIEGLPAQTKTLALIVDDPDAPAGTWVHWVVYNIPPQAVIAEDSIPGEQGINTAGGYAYTPPCPPYGTHRYFFKIYALDAKLTFNNPPSKREIEAAMQGHILDKAEITGLFSK